MARKTQEEKAAEWAAERALAVAAQAAEYPARLMAALEEATQKNNYELTVKNGFFRLRNRDADRYGRGDVVEFSYLFNEEYQDRLESLECDLHYAAEERERALRLRAAKDAALAKLTKDERDLLGL
jgi:hypothetical protein